MSFRERVVKDLAGLVAFVIIWSAFLGVGLFWYGIAECLDRAELQRAIYRKDVPAVLRKVPDKVLEEELDRRRYGG